MPATFQAAIVFALLISPGFLLVQGYRRGRTYTAPDKDLYVLAQAVVASLGWLAVVWLLLLAVGDPVKHWGLLPEDRLSLERHRTSVAFLLLAVEFAPFVLGLAGGFAINNIQGYERVRSALRWTGLLELPTAWDKAWNDAAVRANAPAGTGFIQVRVRLKSGGVVEGRYGAKSRADLSPRASHQLFLETAYGLDDSHSEPTLLGDGTLGGVFIDASEIATIYFES